MTKQFMRDQLEKEFNVKPKESLVERLRKRALIRRSIPRNEPDRIADLLEEAATTLAAQEHQISKLEEMCDYHQERSDYYRTNHPDYMGE